jgi:diguanylate cyclase (GGDEF)-like protein
MAERMAVLAHAAAGVIAADSARALRDVMLEACRRVIVLDDLAFALYDPASASLRFLTDSVPEGTTSIPVASTAYEQVISEKRSSVSVGILAAPDEEDTIGTSATQTLVGDDASVIRTPIIAGGEVLAVLAVRKRSWEPYASLDVEVLEALAAMAATALRNISLVDELRSSQEALSYQAHHDALTGLPNRSRFLDRVARALTNGSPERVCVLALDLDGFKAVNDTLGHAAGDRLLVETAERLQNATRGRDTVARLGGDEFAVLLEQVHDDAESEVVAERILRAMQAPFSFGDRVTVVGASIGIARGDSRESDGGASLLELGSDARSDLALRDPIDALLRNADVALYHAKTAGKGRFAFFDPSMNVAAVERTSLESGLRVAIESNALRLYYQPIIALDSDMVVGVEALLRWTHPERGPVPPSTFIPIAEETGLIVPIGRWVMEEACAQGARWQRRHRASYPGRPPLTISVNVSGRQLQEETFVDDVRRALRVSGLARGTLLLELTESTVVRQSEGMRERLAALKETGVQLAIDDFGTGYSALSYLQHFPIDVLKIDKSFVDGVARGGAQGTLARTIIALGEALSLRTIAEGIEHEDQRRCLQSMGCNLGQGYYFAHPLPAEGFDRYLAAVHVEAACL